MYFGYLFSKEECLRATVRDCITLLTKDSPRVFPLPLEDVKLLSDAIIAVNSKENQTSPEHLKILEDSREYGYNFFSANFKGTSDFSEFLATVKAQNLSLTTRLEIRRGYWLIFFTDTPDKYPPNPEGLCT